MHVYQSYRLYPINSIILIFAGDIVLSSFLPLFPDLTHTYIPPTDMLTSHDVLNTKMGQTAHTKASFKYDISTISIELMICMGKTMTTTSINTRTVYISESPQSSFPHHL